MLTWRYWKYDLPAAVVVFLVAVPLCLGIALACGVEPFAGLLAGIIGGMVVTLFSRSTYGVSGPAAGLIAIVLMGIERLGSYEAFLTAVFLGGILQLLLGIIKAGQIAYFFPSAVIKGMLSAIGIILIIKEIPHAIGYDVENFEWQFLVEGHKNTFYLLWESLQQIEPGALTISLISFPLLFWWQKKIQPKVPYLPGALIIVIIGVVLNLFYTLFIPSWALSQVHRVDLPVLQSPSAIVHHLKTPDFNALLYIDTWLVALTVGLIASLESLLTVEAMDKLDPQKRLTPLNRELFAQGIGNTIAGLIGALPITVVIVRSTTCLAAGAKTRLASFLHGVFLLLATLFFARWLNYIPLASLACILISVGLRLASPKLFKEMWHAGFYQFIPFLTTILITIFTDLLIGITFGIIVGLFFILLEHYRNTIVVRQQGEEMVLYFNSHISFLSKPILVKTLRNIPEHIQKIRIEAHDLNFIDYDIIDILHDFYEHARNRGLQVEVLGINIHQFFEE